MKRKPVSSISPWLRFLLPALSSCPDFLWGWTWCRNLLWNKSFHSQIAFGHGVLSPILTKIPSISGCWTCFTIFFLWFVKKIFLSPLAVLQVNCFILLHQERPSHWLLLCYTYKHFCYSFAYVWSSPFIPSAHMLPFSFIFYPLSASLFLSHSLVQC